MKSIFSDSALARIGKIKKGFLWSAVCLLIGGLSFGGVILLMNASSVEAGKVFYTIAILTFVMFVGVNNLTRMEKRNSANTDFSFDRAYRWDFGGGCVDNVGMGNCTC